MASPVPQPTFKQAMADWIEVKDDATAQKEAKERAKRVLRAACAQVSRMLTGQLDTNAFDAVIQDNEFIDGLMTKCQAFEKCGILKKRFSSAFVDEMTVKLSSKDETMTHKNVETIAEHLFKELWPMDFQTILEKLSDKRKIGYKYEEKDFDPKFASCKHIQSPSADENSTDNGLDQLINYFMNARDEVFAALTGPSGSGKTSLMKWMLHMIQSYRDKEQKHGNGFTISLFVENDGFEEDVYSAIENAVEANKYEGISLLAKYLQYVSDDEKNILNELEIVVVVDEVRGEWNNGNYRKAISDIKSKLGFGHVKLIVGGTNLQHSIAAMSTSSKDICKIRMLTVAQDRGQDLIKWHLQHQVGKGRNAIIGEFVDCCKVEIMYFLSLATNHRCAMFLSSVIKDYIDDSPWRKPGFLGALSFAIIYEVGCSHLRNNGFKRFAKQKEKERVLLDALALCATQPYCEVVEPKPASEVSDLLTIGVIERAVEQNEKTGNIETIRGYEWEMSPALTLLAATRLVPSLMTLDSPADRLEVLGALHLSVLRYAQSGVWKEVSWLDHQIPYASTGLDIYAPKKVGRDSKTLINGRDAPYADVVSCLLREEDTGVKRSRSTNSDKPGRIGISTPYLQKRWMELAGNDELSAAFSTSHIIMQVKASTKPTTVLNVKAELNKMGLHQYQTGKDDADCQKEYTMAKVLNEEMFGDKQVEPCFLTNASFSELGLPQNAHPSCKMITIEGLQNTTEEEVKARTEEDKLPAWRRMYPLVNILSFNTKTRPMLATHQFGKYDVASKTVNRSQSTIDEGGCPQ